MKITLAFSTFKIMLLTLLVLLLGAPLFSQDTTETGSEMVLTIKNQTTEKVITFEEDEQIKVWLTGEAEAIKGKLKIESDSSLSLNGVSVALNDIEKIKRSGFIRPTLGGINLIEGVVIYVAGILLIDKAANTESVGYTLFYVFVGTLGVAIGSSFAVRGTKELIRAGTKYEKTEWEFIIIPPNFSESSNPN